jgi:nitrite reductase/ring-hydroxylating ferredoxin subunit/uncharacterized membrane protein
MSIETQEWLEPAEEKVQQAVARAWEVAGPSAQPVKNFLHGTWLGHPLHPVLTDIPLGSWTAAVAFDLLDTLRGSDDCARAAQGAIGVGLLGAAGAAVTGLTDWQATDGAARRVGLVHALLNVAGVSLFAASWLLRRRGRHDTGRLYALCGFAVAATSAYLGGNLVYAKQIGVDHTAGEQFPRDFVPVLPESELRDGEPRRVDAAGVKVLLVRRGGAIHAIAEVCSHLGGPLAEGQLQGDAIQCPWHASRFSIRDGSVIDGPATHPQPCLQVRVRDGQVEVCGPVR